MHLLARAAVTTCEAGAENQRREEELMAYHESVAGGHCDGFTPD